MKFYCQFEDDDNGTVMVTCPALPEVTTFGEDRSDAYIRAGEAVEEAIAARMADWERIPVSRHTAGTMPVRISLLTEIKLALYQACQDNEISRAELVRRTGWHREQVDRLFRLDHASKASQLDFALETVGREFKVATEALKPRDDRAPARGKQRPAG